MVSKLLEIPDAAEAKMRHQSAGSIHHVMRSFSAKTCQKTPKMITLHVRRPHSTYQKVVQGKSPLHFLHFYGVVCLKALFSNTSALTNSLFFMANSACKGSRTPRLVEHFRVPNFGGLLLEQTICRQCVAFPTWCPRAWKTRHRVNVKQLLTRF